MAVGSGPRRPTTKPSLDWAIGYLKSSETEVKGVESRIKKNNVIRSNNLHSYNKKTSVGTYNQ